MGTNLGRYTIRAKIGEGEVYLAEDTQLHRKVALKVLPAEVTANQDRMRRNRVENDDTLAFCRADRRTAGVAQTVSLRRG